DIILHYFCRAHSSLETRTLTLVPETAHTPKVLELKTTASPPARFPVNTSRKVPPFGLKSCQKSPTKKSDTPIFRGSLNTFTLLEPSHGTHQKAQKTSALPLPIVPVLRLARNYSNQLCREP